MYLVINFFCLIKGSEKHFQKCNGSAVAWGSFTSSYLLVIEEASKKRKKIPQQSALSVCPVKSSTPLVGSEKEVLIYIVPQHSSLPLLLDDDGGNESKMVLLRPLLSIMRKRDCNTPMQGCLQGNQKVQRAIITM